MGWLRDNLVGQALEVKRAPQQPAGEWDRYSNDIIPIALSTQERIDLTEVGNGTGNSAVVACLQVLATRFPEPPLNVMRGDKLQSFHPAALLVDNPNPIMTTDEIWHYAMYACHADGNAYFWKARNRAGRVVELWPLLPDLVEPRGSGRSLISIYEYRPDGHEIDIRPRDIIHCKIGIDPSNHRKGIAPLKSALREVYGDEQASRYTTALTRNTGVPSVLISPKDDDGPDAEEGEIIVEKWNQRVGGERRGNALFLNGPVDVNRLSFSPKDMDLSAIRRLPEERVAAVVGVPPILAGLGTGIINSSGRNETKVLVETFTEGKLIPLWRMFAQRFTKSLLREFTDDIDMTMQFSMTDVRALQPDKFREWQRVTMAFSTGVIKRGEAREELGFEADEDDDLYAADIAATETDSIGSDESLPSDVLT